MAIACPKAEVDTLLTDSRSLTRPASTLFFAIKTPGGNDGHKYIEELYDRGVRNFIVEDIPPVLLSKKDTNVIKVTDTVAALQAISGAFKPEKVKYVGIAGSHGKTTVKEWLFEILSGMRKISRSPRSYNSQIGVPLSLWQVTPESDYAFIEAGISQQGEMGALARCINPQTVILTGVDDEHSEGFSSIREKAKEKVLLAKAPNVATVIYNADNVPMREALEPLLKNINSIGWSFSNPDADLFFCVKNIDDPTKTLKFTREGKTQELKVVAKDDIDLHNVASLIAFLVSENIDLEEVKDRFMNLRKPGRRLDVIEGVNGCVLIKDSYSSDLASIRPALDFMMRRKGSRRSSVVIMADLHPVVGDMKPEYKKAADMIAESGVDYFIGIGEQMEKYSYCFSDKAEFFDTEEDFLEKHSPSDFVDDIILIIEGSTRTGDLSKTIEMLEARTHETVLEVNLGSITANYNYFRSNVPSTTGIICMVKASGYGAGSLEIGRTLQDCGASYLAVAVVDEGVELRQNGITMPIMVMNPKVLNYGSMFENRLEPEIYSFSMLQDVVKEARKREITDYPVHIKLDTGMHRMGFVEEELPRLISLITEQNYIKVSTVFSHLAAADSPELDDYTRLQLDRFASMTEELKEGLGNGFKRHILNSAGILRFPEAHYDFVRLGIGLYGANTLPPEYEKPLDVVSTLRTVIISIREWESGETVGYGRKGVLKRKSRIATIPIGYADGLSRSLGNGRIKVMVNGQEAPTIGNICMDACMIDVTGIDCRTGDAVEIFGRNASLQRIADAMNTIPYEILTSISPRVRRVYYRD